MPGKLKPHGHETRYMKMQKNYCFVCGQDNPNGMKLKFMPYTDATNVGGVKSSAMKVKSFMSSPCWTLTRPSCCGGGKWRKKVSECVSE